MPLTPGSAGGRCPDGTSAPLRTVPPPPLAHGCGAAAAFRQDNYTALHCAVIQCRASCVESLLKAGADASLKTNVSDGHA